LNKSLLAIASTLSVWLASPGSAGSAVLIATSTVSPDYEDFASRTAGLLENGVPGNRLGGMGSGLASMGGDYFIALPDRGPNAAFDVPAKLEGIAFGQDVVLGGETVHTLYVANDNDYSSIVPNSNDPSGTSSNPSRWFVFAFSGDDLAGFVPQRFEREDDKHSHRDDH